MTEHYSSMEMMAIACARRIRNGDIVFCGTGLPLVAVMAAKKTSAPGCIVFFETGSIDPVLDELPLAVADPRVMYGASHNSGLADAFAFMQNSATGSRVVGLLSGAQIDPYGNLNSTAIGDYEKPATRLPGSGGASDVASLVGRTMIFMKHEPRRFVDELDYVTSPGWLTGGSSRAEAGVVRGGPELVITTLGLMRFDEKTKRMYLHTYYEHSSPTEVRKSTGFEMDTSQSAMEPPPTKRELRALRREVDPLRLIIE